MFVQANKASLTNLLSEKEYLGGIDIEGKRVL